MNLSKIEKIIIMVLVVGGILALGIIFLCKPAYESIGRANNNLSKAQTDYDDLMARLTRLDTIDEDIAKVKESISELEDNFYPELTTYEAVEIALAQLKANDLETLSMAVAPATTQKINVETYTEVPLVYNLKTYAQNSKEIKEGEVVLMDGQFLDDDKVYTVSVTNLANVSITNENGEVVEVKDYTDTMIDAYKEAVCRYASNGNLQQTVSAITVNFNVTGEYKKIMNYIDYLYNYEKATYLPTIALPVSIAIEPDEDGNYLDDAGNEIKDIPAGTEGTYIREYADTDVLKDVQISVLFYGVEQVEEVESLVIDGVTVVTNQ